MSVGTLKKINYLKSFIVNPKGAFLKGFLKIRTLWNQFWIDGPTQAMIAHNKKIWAGWVPQKSDKIVLVEFHDILATTVADFYIANIFARKKNARIVSFGRYPLRHRRALHALYKSWNTSQHISALSLSPSQKKRCQDIVSRIRPALKTKQDVFDLTVNGIEIGVDIYDTYLREFNKPTLYFDTRFESVLEWAISVLIYWSDYMQTNEVAGIVVSHDEYIDCNILCRIAYKMKIPVYLPSYFYISHLKRPYHTPARFLAYNRWFHQMTEEEQKEAILKGKTQLEKRLQGKFDGDIWYMPVSAFKQMPEDKRVFRESDKLKVLICTHCFFDSPQCYGGMFFHDFHEWLSFLVDIAKKTDYDWYLKTHPHPLPGTAEVIQSILGENSPITVIPSTTSPLQLVQEGLNHVLTVYGTVGHEYPAIGVQVVNAGHNPHVAFDFTWTPKDLKEYEAWLMDLASLRKKIDLNEIYTYYYMNYYFYLVDNTIFPSAKALLSKVGQSGMNTTEVFPHILKDWSQEHHQNVIERLGQFIDSEKDFLFLQGPISLKEEENVKDLLCNSSNMSF